MVGVVGERKREELVVMTWFCWWVTDLYLPLTLVGVETCLVSFKKLPMSKHAGASFYGCSVNLSIFYYVKNLNSMVETDGDTD